MTRLIIYTLVIAGIVTGIIYGLNHRTGEVKIEDTVSADAPNLQTLIDNQNKQEQEINQENIDPMTKPKNSKKLSVQEKLQMPAPSGLDIKADKKYGALLHTTAGDITVLFNSQEVPNTVNNFVYLARQGFYDDTIFHRTIKGFMIQGGDPQGDGRGGPNYRFADEKFSGKYTRGTMAMANAGPNTNGSQFFIMHADYNLPPNYTIFGQVIKGMEVVDAIATAPTQPGGEGSTPVNPVQVTSVEVIEE